MLFQISLDQMGCSMKVFIQRTFLFFLFGNGIAFADSVPDEAVILAKILASRQSIQRGHVEVESVYTNLGKGEPAFHKKWNIRFEGDTKRHSDITQGGVTTVLCLDCYAERTELYYTTRPPTAPDTTMALVFYDGYGQPSADRIVPNPRWFGCLSDSIENAEFYLSPLEIYGSKPDRIAEYPKVVPDIRENVDCWKVDWQFAFRHQGMSKNVPCTIWVDKSDTSRILRVETRFESDEILYIDGVDSESEKYQNKIWFPTKLTYRRTENGKISESQDTLIKVVSLNEPLPPDTFSPKGIDFLKPGTPVMWALERDRPVEKTELIWDGNNVVARGTFELDKIMEESVRVKPINMFFMLLGIALILFGIGRILWKKYAS